MSKYDINKFKHVTDVYKRQVMSSLTPKFFQKIFRAVIIDFTSLAVYN